MNFLSADGARRGKAVRFLTFFNIDPVHLYKDVGMIPFYLSKTLGWECSITCWSNKLIADSYYERYVRLIKVRYSQYKIIQWLYCIQFAYCNANQYDAVNFYHGGLQIYFLAVLFKIFNSNCKIYIKMDLNEFTFKEKFLSNDNFLYVFLKKNIKNYFKIFFIDIFSVETKIFFNKLKNNQGYTKKLIYLPNGFFLTNGVDINKVNLKENIILTVGRIGVYEKNHELLIDAIAGISQSKLRDWQVLFVGPVQDEFLKYIEDVVKEKDYLRKHLICTGNISSKKDLYKIYAKAKVLCITSRWESFGIVIPEAMYFGNYVITSDFPAAYDLTENGTVGKLFQTGDVQALRQALEEVLDGHINLNDAGQKARQLAQKSFNWEVIVKRLARKLENIGEE